MSRITSAIHPPSRMRRAYSDPVRVLRNVPRSPEHPSLAFQRQFGNQAFQTFLQVGRKPAAAPEGERADLDAEERLRQAMTLPAISIFDDPKGKAPPPKKQEPKKPEKPAPACSGSLLLFKGDKGTVDLYMVDKQYLLQAGKTKVKDPKEATPGSSYFGAAELDPKNCGDLEYVQNVQSNRTVSFKDGSSLEKNTPWVLDTSDPYPTFPVPDLPEGTLKAVTTNDSPAQGSGGVFGFIDTLSVEDNFRLFLMLKSGKTRSTVACANWNWEGKAVTTKAEDTKALLKLDSGKIETPDGSANKEPPKLSPNITEQKFKVVGKGKTLASLFEKIFNGSK